jgi:ornithine cyclodeaminase
MIPARNAPGPRALVPFVSVADMMRLVHHIGLRPMIRALADRIEDDFRRWEKFDKSPRVPAHSAEGVVELMPTTDGTTYGFKFVNGHPGNARDGLQTVTAFGMLADMATGYPVLLSEMTLLTALRTAAMSALAARWLAPPTTTMAIIGTGAQSEFQALAFAEICGLAEVRLSDIDPGAVAKCARNLAGTGLRVIPCASPEEAILGAGIITTVTADKRRATILSDNMVGPGVHLNAVGGDCPGKTELAPGILQRAAIFTEFTPQTRIEGEIQQLAPDHPVTELWQVITGRAPGRTAPAQITLFDSVGFAIEDFAALAYVRDEALKAGTFTPLDLVADPDDPRDLYGMLMRSGPLPA